MTRTQKKITPLSDAARDDLIGRYLGLEDDLPEPATEDLVKLAKLDGDDDQSIQDALEKARRVYDAIARKARSQEMVTRRRKRLEVLVFEGKPEVTMRRFLRKILPQVDARARREDLAHETYLNLGMIADWVLNGCELPKGAADFYIKYDRCRFSWGCPLLGPQATGKITLEEACVASCLILIHHKMVSSHEFRGALGRKKSTSAVGRKALIGASEEATQSHCPEA